MKEKTEFEKLMDDVHYLIVAHCKYKDMSMYDRALKQFQEDINYGQIEVDGYYGEQCTIEQAGVILYQNIGIWKTYREVWERSKRILDIKEDEIWAK